jgi:hypothetical protein
LFTALQGAGGYQKENPKNTKEIFEIEKTRECKCLKKGYCCHQVELDPVPVPVLEDLRLRTSCSRALGGSI